MLQMIGLVRGFSSELIIYPDTAIEIWRGFRQEMYQLTKFFFPARLPSASSYGQWPYHHTYMSSIDLSSISRKSWFVQLGQ